MIQSIDEYYNDVMARGTNAAKILMTEEALMSSTLARKLVAMASDGAYETREHGARAAAIQRELMCLLHSHRAQVLANFMMERAEMGNVMGTEGPIVVPNKPKDGM